MFSAHIHTEHTHDHSVWALLPDSLLHSLEEIVWIIPLMLLAFIFIGFLERGAGRGMVKAILAADKFGPLAGGFLGALPSCGFSAASSNLYSAGLLTTGTLIAVYLSTSDEMLAVLIGSKAPINLILSILGLKAVAGIVCGFLCDWTVRAFYKFRAKKLEDQVKREVASDSDDEDAIEDAMECSCSDPFCGAKGNLFLSALIRTLRIIAFIFIISVTLNILLHYVDKEAVGKFVAQSPILGCVLTTLIGLIPNCAISVALTELYLEGIITGSMMLCGLMTSAGSGLLILFSQNKNRAENITVIALLFVFGLVFGSLFGLLLP